MLIGRRLNEYQTAVDASEACWDKNTWAVLASLVIIAHVFLPLSGVLCLPMKLTLLVLFLALLTACGNLPRENVIIVSGTVGSKCTLKVKPTDAKDYFYQFREIDGKFSVDYTVANAANTYEVTILCAGNIVLYKTIHYPSQVEMFNLGSIGSTQT